MKKLFLLSCFILPALLSACGTGLEYTHTTEPRSVVYMGQPAADLHENFGTPSKIKKLSHNEQVIIYQRQEIEKDWSYRYLHSCEMQFYMVDDRVRDWYSTGDTCAIKTHSNSSFTNTGMTKSHLPFGIPDDAFGDSPLFDEIPENERGIFSGVASDAFDNTQNYTDYSNNSGLDDEFGIFDAPPTKKHISNTTTSYHNIPDDAFGF